MEERSKVPAQKRMNITVDHNQRSIYQALEESRSRGKHAPCTINIKEGNYYLDRPLLLGPEDSHLSIKGVGKVCLSGGRKIENWYRKSNGWWASPLPDVANGKWDFRMLIVNGRFASRARFPEKGFLIHESEFDVRWLSTYEGGFEREPSYEELTTLVYKEGDIGPDFVPENAELTVFHMWDESLVGVKDVDRDKRHIVFSNPSGWPPGAFAGDYNFERRYIIWNTAEGMLQPGQWYLDRKAGEVVYWPLEKEEMEGATVVAPILENILIAQGSDTEAVEGISIENICFSATNAPLMSGAFGAKLFDGALSFRKTRDCEFHKLEILNVGGHCMKIDGDRNKIKNCHLHDAGAGAIRLTGSFGLVDNNHIHDIGKTFPSAIALYVGATDPNVPEEWEPGLAYSNCTISHNELHHVPYAAICAGGKKLTITSNLIYEAMQDLYDGAGIYITFCEDALVKHNFIRDIKDSPGAGTSAYYLDEKAINCLVEENLEINVPRPSHNHIAKNNIFRNNFFIIKGEGYFSMERSEGYTFEKNVVVAEGGFAIFDLAFCPILRNNILFTGMNKLKTRDLKSYTIVKEYELELKDGNLNKDPLLQAYKSGKIVFSPSSPAFAMGIKEIDVSNAGLRKK